MWGKGAGQHLLASSCIRWTPATQLLLAAFGSKLAEATPQAIANTVWAVATMGQQVPEHQLQQLVAALVSGLTEATPQATANTLWAVATMGQQVPAEPLQQLLAALVRKFDEAKPQEIANAVWACAKLKTHPQSCWQLWTASHKCRSSCMP
jgi:hypothetical protein